jgi:hypothetical protein
MAAALARSQRLKAEFSGQRAWSLVFAVAFFGLAIVANSFAQPMLCFCGVVIAIFFVVRAIDAHGQLQSVGLYSTKTLYPRASLLDRDQSSQPATEPKATT